jgi:hypothetical protein
MKTVRPLLPNWTNDAKMISWRASSRDNPAAVSLSVEQDDCGICKLKMSIEN